MTRVDRTDGPEQDDYWTFRDPGQVRSLYEHLLKLDPFPSGTIACPAGRLVVYRLVFERGHESVLTAEVEPAGCPAVIVDDESKRVPGGVDLMLQHMLGLDRQRFLGITG